jgi:DNA polymerase I-like protein with 3'-5' exonuclease and polymerase domains
LIQLDKWLQKERMQSLIVGQVHDSGLLDAAENEIPKILEKVTELVTYNLPRAWKWIIVPLSVEAELSPKGGSWFDKKPVHMGV